MKNEKKEGEENGRQRGEKEGKSTEEEGMGKKHVEDDKENQEAGKREDTLQPGEAN